MSSDVSVKRHVVGRGKVRGLQFQVEPTTHMNVCRFQIARKNAQGQPLPSVPVEMRAYSFSGSLTNEDWVELRQEWAPGELLYPKEILNLTTQVPFRSTLGVANSLRAYPAWWKMTAAIAALLMLAFAGGLTAILINVHRAGGQLPAVGANNGGSPTVPASFQILPNSAPPGSSVAVSGSGWRPKEVVVFRYGPVEMGQVVADGTGSFTNQAITVPSDATSFFKTIEAQGQSTHPVLSQPFTVTAPSSLRQVAPAATAGQPVSPPSVNQSSPQQVSPPPAVVAVGPQFSISPTAASRGSAVTLIGSGYTPQEQVVIYLNDRIVSSGTADGTGHVTARFIVPLDSPPGAYFVHAKGATSRGEFVVPLVTS